MLPRRLTEKFYQLYAEKPLLVRSPGRINLIGDHTDYNEGYVLPAAINRYINFGIAENGTETKCRLYALDLDESFEFDLSDFQPLSQGWQNYLMGVVFQLQHTGNSIKGFDCVFGGNLPRGSGLGSSAALECGLAFGLDHLFDLKIPAPKLARMAQLAEHHFTGVKCGIMDQYACLLGKKDHAMLLDCRNLEFSWFHVGLEDHVFLICDSNIKHDHATSAYNTRRLECDTGVAILKKYHPEISSLRDVGKEALHFHKKSFPPVIYNRCRFVVEENRRVPEAANALLQNDLKLFGNLLYESHAGLRDLYEVSCREIDFLVDLAQKANYVLGARMMGGGFGGCTINLVERSKVDHFRDHAQRQFEYRFGKKLNTFKVLVSDGVSLVDDADQEGGITR